MLVRPLYFVEMEEACYVGDYDAAAYILAYQWG